MKLDTNRTIDPRSHWDKFRRRELWAIANLEGLHYREGAPASEIRLMLQNNGTDPRKYMPQRLGALYGDTGRQVHHVKKELLERRKEEYYEEVSTEQINVEYEDVDIRDPTKMKFNQKKRFCRDHGISYNRRDTNDILLQKIQVFMNGKNLT